MPKTHAGGRPKTSLVWDYFDKDIDNNCSTCTVEKFTGGKAVKCGEKIRGRNPTNLKSHMKSFHAKEFAELLQKEEATKATNTTSTSKSSTHSVQFPKILDVFSSSKWSRRSNKHKHNVRLLARAIVTSNSSTLLADNEEFVEFVQSIQPKFDMPGMITQKLSDF